MKFRITGRVVGHSLFQPNPKDYPELELARVALVVQSTSEHSQKHTKAVLTIDKDLAGSDFALGRVVAFTIEDHQGDLFLPTPSADDDVKATLTFTNPDTGEVVSAPMDLVAKALEKATAARRSPRRAAEQAH